MTWRVDLTQPRPLAKTSTLQDPTHRHSQPKVRLFLIRTPLSSSKHPLLVGQTTPLKAKK
jgi:hypothetical protein